MDRRLRNVRMIVDILAIVWPRACIEDELLRQVGVEIHEPQIAKPRSDLP